MKISQERDLFWPRDNPGGLFRRILRKIDQYWMTVFARSLMRDIHCLKLRQDIQEALVQGKALFNKKINLAAVAIVKGEDGYLREWIAFHRLVGFEHFFIYDNGASEATRKILDKEIAEGVLTYTPFPDIPGMRAHNSDLECLCAQELAYGHFVRHYSEVVDWFMQIDLDEFCYPTISSGEVDLRILLKKLEMERVYAVEVNMHDFGSSWHKKQPSGLVVENYRHCRSELRNDVKTLALVKEVKDLGYSYPHTLFYKNRLRKTLQRRSVLKGMRANNLFRLNHYVTKSFEEYSAKCQNSSWLSGKYTHDLFYKNEKKLNQAADNGEVLRFLSELTEVPK